MFPYQTPISANACFGPVDLASFLISLWLIYIIYNMEISCLHMYVLLERGNRRKSLSWMHLCKLIFVTLHMTWACIEYMHDLMATSVPPNHYCHTYVILCFLARQTITLWIVFRNNLYIFSELIILGLGCLKEDLNSLNKQIVFREGGYYPAFIGRA